MSETELTRREKDVLVALCRPLHRDDVVAQPASVREIAAELVVTAAAVKQHLLHLYDKLGIAEGGERRRVALAREAIRLGVVEAPARSSRTSAAVAEDPLASGRDASERHEWERAAELLEEAAAREPLAADDLVLLGEALLWANRHDESFTAQEHAYHAYLRAGAEKRAGYVAVLLTVHNAVRLDMAVAGGWLAKAQKLLEPEPDCREHGYLAFVLTLLKEAAGDWEAVLELAGRMRELGRRHGDADLEALGLAFQGLVATRRGSVEEGGRLLDEAMTSAVAGELGMLATGVVYCRMICACLALHDYRRAGEWTDVVDRCGHTAGLGGFPGDCRTHCTAVLVKRGAWAQGEQEALPGMSLVQLGRGDVAAAAASIEEALENPALDALARAPLLRARVEIALSDRDIDALRAAADELDQTAEMFGTPALAGSAAYANGAAELTGGDPLEAARLLTLAQHLWLDAEAPYEAARTRELLAQAQLAAGKHDSSRLELRATRAAFQRLGAPLDTERVERRLAALA